MSKVWTYILEIENINQNQDWIAFDIGEFNEKARTGAPSSLARHDMGLFTVIGRTDRDASGGKLDPKVRSTMQRLRTWDFRTSDAPALTAAEPSHKEKSLGWCMAHH